MADKIKNHEFRYDRRFGGFYYLIRTNNYGKHIYQCKKYFFTIEEYKTIMRQYKI